MDAKRTFEYIFITMTITDVAHNLHRQASDAVEKTKEVVANKYNQLKGKIGDSQSARENVTSGTQNSDVAELGKTSKQVSDA